MNSSIFATSVRHQVSDIFGDSSPANGLPQDDILVAEARLGFRLPEILRQFYLAVGTHKKAMDGMSHVLVPKKLLIRRKALVFCEEQQRAYFWGIQLEDAQKGDPAVSQGGYESDNWYPDSAFLSCFLSNTICWQATNALKESAKAEITDEQLQQLKGQFKRSCKADPIADKQVLCAT